ncbi:MAG TPA: universal stress protein [Nitrososphaeraceae archaeon]|jgi:nucleotide-binding universal stress UspA family protein
MSKQNQDKVIKKILVAVDGSKPSLDAAEKAVDIADGYGARLIGLYVISPNFRYEYDGSYLTSGTLGPFRDIVNIAMDKGQKFVDQVKEMSYGKGTKVETEVRVAADSVVKEIVNYAEKENVDLIVIGTRGMSGFKRMLLGSTASGVVTYSHCPVLVVR